MNKITFFLIVSIILSFNSYCQINEQQVLNLLDSTDLKILFGKKKIRMFEMIGAPVDSTMQNKKSKYIFNYLVKESLPITNSKLIQFISPLLNCKTTFSQIPKCTFLARYCIEIGNNKAKLYIFFSELGVCENFMKVVKLNTINHKEGHAFFDSNQFAKLF